MLINELDDEDYTMNEWFEENDIVILDRGYRDLIEVLHALGILSKMPAFLEAGQR